MEKGKKKGSRPSKKKKQGNWKIKVEPDDNPVLARVIIEGPWCENVEQTNKKAKRILEKVCTEWSKHKKNKKKVSFLITCGGFMKFAWPKVITTKEIGNLEKPNPGVLNCLTKEAEEQCKKVIGPNLRKELSKHAEYITIGIDSFPVQPRQLQIELVAMLNLQNNKYDWTGKSYPHYDQEKRLVRFKPLESHFKCMDRKKVMVLVCHDLFAFANRGSNVSALKSRLRENFRELAKENNITWILHHPHTTASTRTWPPALGSAKNLLGEEIKYASAGRYYRPPNLENKRNTLEEVRCKTKNIATIDFVCYKG